MQLAIKVFKHFHSDSLYRNSIYLMMSTFILAVFGFVFWILCSKFYSTEQIGLATAMISVTNLIGSFSIFGFNYALIKYLPTTHNKNQLINTIFSIIGIISLVITGVYLMFINFFSPKLSFIVANPYYLVLFIALMIISSINIISDSVFIAYRSTFYVLVYNAGQSVIKLILPLALISFGSFGIFLSMGIGTTVALALTLLFLYLKFNYRTFIAFDKKIIKEIFSYSSINFVSGFIGTLPQMLMPLLITNQLGAKASAYYYMPMMISNLLYIIPATITRSLFAESFSLKTSVYSLTIKAIKITYALLIPAVIGTFVLGPYVLTVFGKNFSSEGKYLLYALAFSTLFAVINYVCSTIINIKGKLNILLAMSVLGTILTLGFTQLFIGQGLVGIGFAWLLSQIITAITYMGLVYFYR